MIDKWKEPDHYVLVTDKSILKEKERRDYGYTNRCN